MFTTLHMGNYQPLSWLAICLQYSLWGMHPLGYHAVSLALHGLNAVLFFGLAMRLLRAASPSGGPALPIAVAIGTLFFALPGCRNTERLWPSSRTM
jgi:hypothetical protein